MTEIPEDRSQTIRTYKAMKPAKWYFYRKTKADRYTQNIAHFKKGGFATSLEHDMLNGHRERIHAFPTQELIDYLESQLLLAEEIWKSAQNDLQGVEHPWTWVKDLLFRWKWKA